MWDDLKEACGEPLPEGFHERLMERIRAERKRTPPFPLRCAGIAAAAACAVFTVSLGIAGLGLLTGPEPPSAVQVALMSGGAGSESSAAERGETLQAPAGALFAPGGALSRANHAALSVGAVPAVSPQLENAYVIRQYNIRLTAENIDAAVEGVKGLGGTVVMSSVSAADYGAAAANLVCFFPPELYEDAVYAARALGEVESAYETQEDVTSRVNDAKARLSAKETERVRLMDMLGKTEKVEHMVTVENRLSDVIYEIENLSGEVRSLVSSVGAPTLSVAVSAVQAAAQEKPPAFGERAARAFSGSIGLVSAVSQALAVGFAALALPLLALGAVITAAAVIWRYRRRRL
jgi:hypothetical protein